jgi:glycerol kinase
MLALDQGTTSSRALVVAADGGIVASAQREIHQHYPASGWVEHDPEQLVATLLDAAAEAIAAASITSRDLAGIGITNQRETIVAWERATLRPVAPAIVWQDRRTADACRALTAAGHDRDIRRRTGLVIDPYFSATKLAWLLREVPGLRRRAERGAVALGTVDAWLVARLTGGEVHVTDASNASRTMLYDIHRGDWDDELCQLFGVPRAALPRVVDSSGVIGVATGSLASVPIAGIAGDQQAALFGQACLEPGLAKCTYGTGCFLLMHTGDEPAASSSGLLTTVAWQLDGRREYALEGSVFSGGAVVQWLRDELGLISAAADVEPLARRVADSGGVVVVPAFTGLGAPWWDPYARGVVCGLSRGSSAAHLARACLEAIALQVYDLAQAMTSDAGRGLVELRVDGGASRNDLLLEIQASLLEVPCRRSRQAETTGLGAAYLAGLGVGYWPDRAAIDALWQCDRQFDQRLDAQSRAGLLNDWHRAVERARGWAAS